VDGEDSDDPEAKSALQHEHTKDKNINKNNKNNENTTRKYQCKGVKQELESWRESIQIEDMINICKHPRRQTQLTAATLASGGLLDTMAAIRSGFKIIWGSEIDETMTKMWDSMTHAVNYGDAEGIDYSTIEVPDVVFSGMPCPDWTNLGSEDGEEGNSGYLYTKQINWLITLKKRGMVAAVLEQTSNATSIANGKPVENMLNVLLEHFYVHYATIPVWKYGDVSNRQRLYIILFSKSLGQYGSKYKFPLSTNKVQHKTLSNWGGHCYTRY
jgi:site-specific DNA-cytosine methylase